MAQQGQKRVTPLDSASKQLQQILSGFASLLATTWLAGRMRPLLGTETPPKRRYIKHTRWKHREDGSVTYLCLTEKELSVSAVEREQEPADYILYLMYNLTSLQRLRYARMFMRVAQQVENRPEDVTLQSVYGYDLPWRSMRHAVFRYNVMYLLLRVRSCERIKREAVVKRRQVKALRSATSQVPSGLSKLKPGFLPAAVPSSPLSPTLGYRVVTVVTTAALPWLTGTSINPLLRAAYLERLEHVKVNLMIPWLETPDQRIVYPRDLVFPTPAAQEQHIREWLLNRLNLDVHFRIVFYPARFDVEKNSIFPAGGFDLTPLIPPAEADVAVLEEPEHLCWYHFGPKWRQVFQLVVGIIHTNYYEYVRRQPVDKGGGPVLAFLLWFVNVWRTRANCHLAIRLSEGVQYYADATVCNVHGVGPQFLTVHRHLRPPHRSMNGSSPDHATQGSGAQTAGNETDSAGVSPEQLSVRVQTEATGSGGDMGAEPAQVPGPSTGVTRGEGGFGGDVETETGDVDRSADDVSLDGGMERAAIEATGEGGEGDEQPLVFDKGCYFIGKMLWAKGYRELCDLLLDHCKRQRGEGSEPPVAKKRRLLKVPFRLRRVETKSRGGTGLYRRNQKIGVEAMKQVNGASLPIDQGAVTASETEVPMERPRQDEVGVSREEGDVSRGRSGVAEALDDVSRGGVGVRRGGDAVTRRADDISRERDDVSRRGDGVSRGGSDVCRKGDAVSRSADDISRRGDDVSSREPEAERAGNDVEELRAFVEPYDSDGSDEPGSPLSRAWTDPGAPRDRHDDVTEWSHGGAKPYLVKVRNGGRQVAVARPTASMHGRRKLRARGATTAQNGNGVGNGLRQPSVRPFVRADPDDAASIDGVDVSRANVNLHGSASASTRENAVINTRRNVGVHTRNSSGVNTPKNAGVNADERTGAYAPESTGANGLEADSPDAKRADPAKAHANGFEIDSPLKVRLSVESAPGGNDETERSSRLIAHETEGAAQHVSVSVNGLEGDDVARLNGLEGADVARVNGLGAADVARLNGLEEADVARVNGLGEADVARVNGLGGADVAVTSASVTELDADVAGRRSAVQVDCYGTGGEEEEIIEFAREHNLPVVFHGRRDHADASLWGYKVFVNPSCSDVLCTTTAEALAMGKFVVVADHPSNIFFAEHFPENTVLYDPDVPVEFSQAIQRALAGHPAPLTSAQRRMLTWEAATERFMRAAKLL